MKAEITYNAGKTYRIKGVKFEQGKTKVVAEASVIRKCQMTAGFSVRILEAAKPVKKKAKSRKVRQVEKADSASSVKPVAVTKKKDKGKSSKSDS